jgi:serine/threonine protein kinase/tetratricopeptide (TPR) repeat protein
MDAEKWKRVKELLDEALDMSLEQRTEFLAKIAEEESEISAEVDALLSSVQDGETFLEDSIDLLRDPRGAISSIERGQIGPYRLLERLGEGGMGVVYLAEQDKPIKRQVAIKLIKLGMDTDAVISRFDAERQALARMDHPNIAKVLDAGATEEGRPYFVMDYVNGVPITEYCDKHRLSTKERVKLFIDVCQGVQHAHQKAIIHRDIKPSNVLVDSRSERPVPKIIDFGVAKATDQRLTENTIFTELGVLVGTPEYMSPEQAQLSSEDIDTRTDVYSLGVLLYELLVGALPFDAKKLRRAGFDEIRRTIREEEPFKPSARVTSLGPASKESARHRRTDSRSLERELRGDLDAVTMKALGKSPSRRYDSPQQLASDLQRHLERKPIIARPPGLTYRTKRFIDRHRFAVGVSVLVVAAILGAGAITTESLLRSLKLERQRAQELTSVVRLATSLIGGPSTNLESLEQFVRQSVADDAVRAGFFEALGFIHFENGRYSKAEAVLLESRKLWEANSRGRLRSLAVLGIVRRNRADYGGALDAFREALVLGESDVSLFGKEAQFLIHRHIAAICGLRGDPECVREADLVADSFLDEMQQIDFDKLLAEDYTLGMNLEDSRTLSALDDFAWLRPDVPRSLCNAPSTSDENESTCLEEAIQQLQAIPRAEGPDSDENRYRYLPEYELELKKSLLRLHATSGSLERANELYRYEIPKVGDAFVSYEAARLASLIGRREEALMHLHAAAEKGYSDPWIEVDPDFALLHGDADFEEIVEVVKGRTVEGNEE